MSCIIIYKTKQKNMQTADQLIHELSSAAGGASDVSPFVSKTLLTLSDNNSSSNYSSNVITWELSQWSNNGRFINLSDAFIVIPIVMQLNSSDASVDFSVIAQSEQVLSLKNTESLIHNVSLDFGNGSIMVKTDHINQYLLFRKHTDTISDEEHVHDISGYTFDDSTSASYTDVLSSQGAGLCNNFTSDVPISSASQLVGSICNHGAKKRGEKCASLVSQNGLELITGASADVENMFKDVGRDYVERTADSIYWFRNAVLRLKDICPFFASPDCPKLLRGSVFRLSLTVNQCRFDVLKTTAGMMSAPTNLMIPSGGCNPLMVAASYKSVTQKTSGPAITDIAPGAVVHCAGASSVLTANKTYQISCSVVETQFSHATTRRRTAISNCRLYAHAYQLTPQVESSYLSLNQKKISFTALNAFQIYNLASGASFSQIVTNGIKAAKRMIICPFMNASTHFTAAPFAQLSSPYDSCPSTVAPSLISNFQVMIGGSPLYPVNMKYGFERFLNEMANTSQSGFANMVTGICGGRIGFRDWESIYGYYVVDLRRRLPEEKTTLQSISISGTILSKKALDLYIWIEYEDSCVVDLVTGQRLM